MVVLLVKFASALLLLGIGLTFGLGAHAFAKKFHAGAAMSICNAVAGGVFMSLGLTHILPEAVDGFAEVDSEAKGIRVGYVMALVTYLLCLLLDKVILRQREIEDESLLEVNGKIEPETPGTAKQHIEMENPYRSEQMEGEEGQCPTAAHSSGDLPHSPPRKDGRNRRQEGANASAYILLLTLSIHSIFEGLACGVQNSLGNTLSLVLGIVAHKWAAALGLGVRLSSHGIWVSFFCVVIFSVSAPAGILFGEVIKRVSNPIVEATTMALAAGSFLYIGASEIIMEEFASHKLKWTKLVAYSLAAGCMLLVSLAEG